VASQASLRARFDHGEGLDEQRLGDQAQRLAAAL
jgi:hypothetical protein